MKIPYISSSSHTSSSSSAGASGSQQKAQGTVDRINKNLNELSELQKSLSLLATNRAAKSPDPIIQQFANDAMQLNRDIYQATNNANVIIDQLQRGKLNPEYNGPHHDLIAKTDTLISHMESLSESYRTYQKS
ncbi:hypothetical protein BIY29_01625 [Brenneria alni]|uniref:Uncharacterized protein n=1 Tax=Brenneria alni TaxID=71656 RepID=A0A421DTF1_9GAMM|nr:hypothetical protein [Brenneria alni]RLM27807.1 hypothetical protein BIY29_01625 [Brenneria alni]